MRCKKHSFLWSVYISNYLEQGEMCVVEGERERERRSNKMWFYTHAHHERP